MAYPGEYRREEYYGEDGYAAGGNYGARGYQTEPGYGGDAYGGNALPLFGEQYDHHKHGHHQHHHHHHNRPDYVPEVEYVQPGVSDLGMGLRDSNYVQGGYGVGYGRNQPGYAVPAAYGPGGYDSYEHAKVNRLEEELAHERRRTHEAEAAAAAATVYAIHERHERKETEQELERFEPGAQHRHKHHFFNL